MSVSQVDGILWDANDKFNPAAACKWDLGQIVKYAKEVYYAPNEWGITDKEVVDALHHSWPIVDGLLAKKLVFDENNPARTGLGFISCSLHGVSLPAYTVYDYFGWLLTVSTKPRPDATSQNFYLPLLSCFANWCLKIATYATRLEHAPVMVSIAAYERHTLPSNIQGVPWRAEMQVETRVFLGASIPDQAAFQNDHSRATIINHGRQLWLEECGLKPKDEDQRRGTDSDQPFQEPSKGFGRCAETFFWVYAKETEDNLQFIHNIKGVALVVRQGGEPTIPLDDYNEEWAFEALANPCSYSCRYLAEQIQNGKFWGKDFWRFSFDKAHVKEGRW